MTGAVLTLAGAGGSSGGGGGGGSVPDTSWANIFSQYSGINPAVTLEGFSGSGSLAASLSGAGALYYVKNGTYTAYAGAFSVEAGDAISWGVAAAGGVSVSGTVTVTSGGATIDTFTYHIVVSPAIVSSHQSASAPSKTRAGRPRSGDPMRRTLDPAFLNAVANDPEVRPWIGGTGPLDLGPLIADPANIALETAHGGWVLIRHEAGIYELHTLFRKAGRGQVYFELATAALDYVFAATDAREIVTRVPANNRAADLTAARCGFAQRFMRAGAFTDPNGALWDVSYQALDIDRWMMRSAAALAAARAFHEAIEAARGKTSHPEDEAHDHAAGAAALMIRAGNPRKGVWAYNRWARLAGYAPIALISETPLAIDVVDAVIGMRGGEMEVLLCR